MILDDELKKHINPEFILMMNWPGESAILQQVAWFRKDHTQEELEDEDWYWWFMVYNANHPIPQFVGCLPCYRKVFNWLKETYGNA